MADCAALSQNSLFPAKDVLQVQKHHHSLIHIWITESAEIGNVWEMKTQKAGSSLISEFFFISFSSAFFIT